MRTGLCALVLGVSLVFGGCDDDAAAEETPGGDQGLPGDPEAGAAVYQRICVACHAADGKGNGGITGANFVDDQTRLTKTNGQLLTSIREGVSTGPQPMPAQGAVLSEQEMRDALSYIRREFGGTQE